MHNIKDLGLLNYVQQNLSVFFINSTIDGNTTPIQVNAQIRMPNFVKPMELVKGREWDTANLSIKVDKMLRRVVREFGILLKRRSTGQISDITINAILCGLYGPNYQVYKHRSLINRSLKQLKPKSKIRKYVSWRLIQIKKNSKLNPRISI